MVLTSSKTEKSETPQALLCPSPAVHSGASRLVSAVPVPIFAFPSINLHGPQTLTSGPHAKVQYRLTDFNSTFLDSHSKKKKVINFSVVVVSSATPQYQTNGRNNSTPQLRSCCIDVLSTTPHQSSPSQKMEPTRRGSETERAEGRCGDQRARRGLTCGRGWPVTRQVSSSVSPSRMV